MASEVQTKQRLAYQPQDLRGKRILLTGGTTGIGRATALLLASQGASVLTFGRHQQELDDAMRDLKGAGAPVFGLTADTSKYDDIERVFRAVDEQLGGLDVLVNNAALPGSSILDSEFAEWDAIVRTNLLGYMACARMAIDRFRQKGEGDLVFIGSMSADVREKGSSVYVATKAGIQGFSEALRKEVDGMGIRVILIEPGSVGTNLSGEPPDVEKQRQQQEQHKQMAAEDIAELVLYAISQPRRVELAQVQIKPHKQII